MKKYIWLGILAVIIIVVLWLVGYYNSFIGLNESVNTSWAQVENQYQRRYDLIPNLVETVKGYAAHEKGVLENVTKARTMAMGAKTADEHVKAENMLSSTLKTSPIN